MAGEQFEPIETVKKKGEDIKEFKVDMNESLGELGEENSRLKFYMDDQKDLVEKHLKAFKEKALYKYTTLIIFKNEEAINRAMDQYAKQMNALLKRAVSMLLEIAEGIDDDDISNHYDEVEAEFGAKLDKMIDDDLNKLTANIIENAALPTVAEKTTGIMDDIRSRKERLENIGK